MALFKGSKEAPPAAEGESAAECMKVGQALVESGQLTAEHLAGALAQANGDLLQCADIALGRYGAGRKWRSPSPLPPACRRSTPRAS